MGEINILDLILYTKDLINAEHVTDIRWLALTDYTVTNISAHIFLYARLERIMGFFLNPVTYFWCICPSLCVWGWCCWGYVSIQVDVHMFFPHCCHVTNLFCDQRVFWGIDLSLYLTLVLGFMIGTNDYSDSIALNVFFSYNYDQLIAVHTHTYLLSCFHACIWLLTIMWLFVFKHNVKGK